MRTFLLAATATATAIAIAIALPATATAQAMPGMDMSAHRGHQARPTDRAKAKWTVARRATASQPAAGRPAPARAAMPGASGAAAPVAASAPPARAADQVPQPAAQAPAESPHAGHDVMTGMEVASSGDTAAAAGSHGDHTAMDMPAAFGPYPMAREGSGTAWQPDASPMQGVMRMSGDWFLMGQVVLNGVYDAQSGRRGDDKAFVAGMVMGMATGRLSERDTVQFRAMLSPDPLMGGRGYPLLLAAGETADGRTQLVDRQHPHDLFMELSASYSRSLGGDASAFIYAALPGEPAFGPGSFMHRLSIMDSPEAPITHHWFDSTHITFGVLTAGVVKGGVKLEGSRFTGREPDQHRYDLERPHLDSISVRASWNPSPTLSLQASWARLKSPEQLEPDEDQERWSASAIWTRPIGAAGYVSATAAWGRKTQIEADGNRGPDLDAYLLEAAVKPDDRWTVFARAERIDTDELLSSPGVAHGPVLTVGKDTVGAIHDLRLARDVRLGLGGLFARSFTPGGLDPAYGGNRSSGMVFVRVKIG